MLKKKIYNVLERNRYTKKILQQYNRVKNQKYYLDKCISQIGEREVVIYGCSQKAIKFDEILIARRKKGGCKYYIDENRAKEEEKINNKIVVAPEDLLMDESFSELCVVFPDYDNLMPKMEKLFDLGLSRDQIVIWERAEGYLIGCKKLNVYDVFLGYSRIDDLPGFTIFTNKQTSSPVQYTIVTLGGSTTDPTFSNLRSWSEFLYRKISDMGMDVTVFCGGVAGYNSTQELLKLIRDVIPMKPDMVISYSGVNNLPETEGNFVTRHPFIRRYQKMIFENAYNGNMLLNYSTPDVDLEGISLGLPNDKDSSEYWVDDMRIMHSICKEFDISFYGFLQPHRNYGGYITHPQEYCSDDEDYTAKISEWFESTRKRIESMEYMTDLSQLFRGKRNLYFDRCHVYAKANEQIAGAILRIILPEIRMHFAKEKN